MGNAHVLYLYEDALRFAEAGMEVSSELAEEIGRSVVKLCMDPHFAMEPEGPRRVTWHPIGKSGNALNWVDDPHSTEARAYLWAGNTLQPLRDLDLERLHELKALVERELANRT
jgi:hypothetical protein